MPNPDPSSTNIPPESNETKANEAPAPPKYSETTSPSGVPTPVGPDFITKSDTMIINLGPSLWGFETPTYGKEGTVSGVVELSCKKSHVSKVEAKIHGDFSVTSVARLVGQGKQNIRFLDEKVAVYNSEDDSMMRDSSFKFTFKLPSVAEFNGKSSPLPPSFDYTGQYTRCTALYIVKVEMYRKWLRQHETVRIPIMYFPQSRPTRSPTSEIPKSLGSGSSDADHDGFKTVQLSKKMPHDHDRVPKTENHGGESGSTSLTIPSPPIFTSGDPIPFLLKIDFQDSPATTKLLASNVHIDLARRRRADRLIIEGVDDGHTVLGVAKVIETTDVQDGVISIRGVVPSGEAGKHTTWVANKLYGVEYFIRATVSPPDSMSGHIPSWESQIAVELTTDGWDTLDAQMAALNGMSPPALEMAKDAPKITPYSLSLM